MATEAIRVENLSKSFGGLRILEDLSFTINAGEYVAIIGPNGAGKTTLLNLLTGELAPTRGRIYCYGREITNMPTCKRTQIGLGRSFQITRLFNNLMVLTNMSLAIQGKKYARYNMLQGSHKYLSVLTKAQSLLESVELWDKRNEIVNTLSYGEKRRLELALSLASDPKVLLMDEPSAGLDIAEIPDFLNKIKILTRDMTLIFVAHDMDVVFGLAERIAVLYYGNFIADGTPENIQANVQVREIYLGMEEEVSNA